VNKAERDHLIASYREGADVIAEALNKIGLDGLDRRQSAEDWSPREIVHHLADSEMTSAIRLRRLVVEDNPEIVGYDQEQFARKLFYDRPIEASLAAVRASRESTAEILGRLNAADWQRTGTHTEGGEYGVEIWLRIYARHCHDHAEQMLRAAGIS
jgi:hypothetical protein